MDVVWEDPPPAKTGASAIDKWHDLIDAMKAHPGKWAILEEGLSGTTAASRRLTFQRLGFEFAQRASGKDGVYTAYARWPEVGA